MSAQRLRPGANARDPRAQVGEHFRFPDAAYAAPHRRDQGPRLLRSELAERIAAFSKECGGAMTLEDLRGYRPEWVKPISRSYRGYELHEIPPNGRGIAALIALGIVERFDMASMPVDSVQSQHVQIEAMKLAFADLYKYVADPRSMEVTPEQMLSDAWTAAPKLIRLDRATHFEAGCPHAGGTVYLTAADENGMMISFISQLHGLRFGRGGAGHRHQPAEPGRGFLDGSEVGQRGRRRQASVPHHHRAS